MNDTLRDTLSLRESNVRRYFPDVLANACEFIAYADVLEPELNLLIKKILGEGLNTFVYDIDEQGAARYAPYSRCLTARMALMSCMRGRK